MMRGDERGVRGIPTGRSSGGDQSSRQVVCPYEPRLRPGLWQEACTSTHKYTSFAARTQPRGPNSLHTPERSNAMRSEEHTSELQSRQYLVCRLLLEKKT